MCGIAGIIDFNNKKIEFEEAKNFFNSINHRGPDFSDYLFNENKTIFLGSKRLKILDLKDRSNQPFYNKTNNLILVYNGEIYNYLELKSELVDLGHRFHTSSDTEVVLKSYEQWGEECQKKFDGMWSFAIFDKNKNRLFLSRDRYGEKPLYYKLENQRIYFSSELKSFLKLNKFHKIDLNEKYFLNLRNIENSPETLIKKVSNLNASCQIIMSQKNFEIKRWWNTNDYLQHDLNLKNEQELNDIFENLLINSLKTRIRSDAKISFSLSGGLDSSILYCLATKKNQINKDVKGVFSFFEKENNHDFNYIKEIEKQNSIILNFINPKKISIKDLEDCIFFNESIDNVNLLNWYHYKFLNTQDVKVSIEGHGPDELLGGYDKYEKLFLNNKNTREKNYTQIFNKNFIHESKIVFNIYFILRKFFSLFLKKYDKKVSYKNKRIAYFSDYSLDKKKNDYVNNQLFADFHNLSLRNILKNFDRISMAHGIEVRSPYLNHDIVNFLFSLSSKYKIDTYDKKKILKNTFKKYLPVKIYSRKNKQGFHTEYSEFINHEIFDYLKNIIYSTKFQKHLITENIQFKSLDKKSEYEFIKKYFRIIRTFILLQKFEAYKFD